MNRLVFFLCILISLEVNSQEYWHDVVRYQRYAPEGMDIVIQNGSRRFNRALYGGNTAFRVEAGDRPEFGLYLPGMGGNLKFGLIRGGDSKWLIQAASIKSIYRAGSMLYEIQDPLFGHGKLSIHLIPSFERENVMVKIEGYALPDDLYVIPVFGGVSGKKFSRDGDIGADPESSFDLKPEYCVGNTISLEPGNTFIKSSNGNHLIRIQSTPNLRFLRGDANAQLSPLMLLSAQVDTTYSLIYAKITLSKPLYFSLDADDKPLPNASLMDQFDGHETQRQAIADRVVIHTPDTFINAMAAPLSIAADAIWESPAFMHGAVAWRMWLNGWRGGYIADILGWHDRARTLFDGYLGVQIKGQPSERIEMDTALQLARHREVLGTSLFSSGYISREPNGKIRPHHYDMNLVLIDQLIAHLNWTGDTAYARKVWDNLVLHLNWEKRNFDADDDGLYDAYAAIWASDALQYSAGAVTHSSAYNYSANLKMVELGKILGKEISSFKAEADKILKAINKQLWLSDKGWYAEFKDHFGNKLIHDQPGVWTIYHAIDEGIADPFQAWQTLRFIDHHIPHIPMRIKGFSDTSLYTIATTSWQPYTWSLNNVALPELMHTALAYWQGQRYDEAYKLFRSSILESMYFGASPGNVQLLTFYDAMRGELYRDFADAIGTTGRSLIEGLFGIQPLLLQKQILLRPGFPSNWDSASIRTLDLSFSFLRSGGKTQYKILHHLGKDLHVKLQVPVFYSTVKNVLLNGKPVRWSIRDASIDYPMLEILTDKGTDFTIEIMSEGNKIDGFESFSVRSDNQFIWNTHATILKLIDPQQVFSLKKQSEHSVTGSILKPGIATVFVKLKEGNVSWWHPIHLNRIQDVQKQFVFQHRSSGVKKEVVDLSSVYNAQVTDIFKNKYLSPRPTVPTLQLPVQGIGNWAYPLVQPEIMDSGLRSKADANGIVQLSNGLTFKTGFSSDAFTIAFVSQWDNYPDSIQIPLSGQASFAHMFMAGSTNPMQSRIINGTVEIAYTDGTYDTLELRNPENWWPIEQDYYTDGYAFTTGAPKPTRISLKTGAIITEGYKYTGIKGFTSYGIEGGAATVLGLPLNAKKILRSLKLKAIANDVVIGLMGLTLER